MGWRADFPILRRADHWPLCPQCGEDELWSPFLPGPPDYQGTVDEYVAAGLYCYSCPFHYPRAA